MPNTKHSCNIIFIKIYIFKNYINALQTITFTITKHINVNHLKLFQSMDCEKIQIKCIIKINLYI
jgi:hypothetical protein